MIEAADEKIMRSTPEKRFRVWICLFVVLNLAFVPALHASMLGSGDTMNTAHESSHDDCLNHAAESGNEHASDSHPQGHVSTGCEHGVICTVLCGISVSSQAIFDFPDQFAADHWVRMESSPLQSSILSRLERPPRS